MSRFGGFRIGKFRIIEQWADRVSTSASVPAPATIQDFDYSTAKGIWSLRSTTHFPKKPFLYAFSSFTFTNGSTTGPAAPTLANLISGYDTGLNSWLTDTSFFTVQSGIQLWTVPQTGTYRITAVGAKGGNSLSNGGVQAGVGGSGARMQGDFVFTQRDQLRILVGQMGIQGSNYAGGGGGGSFVLTETGTTVASVLIAAGGGGGGGLSSSPNGVGGTILTAGTADASNNVAGGTNGTGGAAATSGSYIGAGGAGFLTNGGNQNQTGALGPASGGVAIINGGTGGTTTATINAGTKPDGGFGGGGAGVVAGGGGGGYSGGGAGGVTNYSGGGGGGSVNTGANPVNVAATNASHGFVLIDLL